MAVKEADIKKTTFRAGSSGLHEFTQMPFRLFNSRSSVCCIMVMCFGGQQFVTLLLYLDDICVFATSIDEMLDHIELVFKWLEEFNLKIKPKKYSNKWNFSRSKLIEQEKFECWLGHKEILLLSAHCSLPGACTICRGYFCKPWEGGQGKELVSANQSKGITIILGVGLLLSQVNTKVHCNL